MTEKCHRWGGARVHGNGKIYNTWNAQKIPLCFMTHFKENLLLKTRLNDELAYVSNVLDGQWLYRIFQSVAEIT